jgi:hypothetical protein
MTPGVQRAMAWSGVGFAIVGGIGSIMVGLLPPVPPSRTAAEVAQFWSTNAGLRRCGIILMLAASAFLAPFGALIAVRLKQMEGRFAPMAYLELAATAVATMSFILAAMVFAAASYRPERDPQITQALDDLGWLSYIMLWPPATCQCLAVTFAIFGAKQQIWPRWLAYLNAWVAFIVVAGGLAVLFKDGVFAWNGLLAFWLVAIVFGMWYTVMTWQMLVTIPRDAESDDAAVDKQLAT